MLLPRKAEPKAAMGPVLPSLNRPEGRLLEQGVKGS